jgi:peptidoglycan pentaglycine glycine transferase (the first glycine)
VSGKDERGGAQAFMMELVQDESRWNAIVSGLPQAHILQTWQWGQVKARLGWKMLPYAWRSAQGELCAAALVLQRTIPSGGFSPRLRLFYVPRGPMLDWSNPLLRECVLDDLKQLAQRQGAIFIKIDPEVSLGTGVPGTPEAVDDPRGAGLLASLKARGWLFSDEQIQFRNTVLIDLAPPEEALLNRMKQKTRYNIHLAGRKGVTVRSAGLSDLPMLFKMYAETSLRDGFVIRDQAYYEYTWGTMLQSQMADILVAEVEGQANSAVVVFRFAGKAWYLNGMSRDLHREKMPNYLLQWEAMRRAKAAGCLVYDLWGAPDAFDESDPLWGVFRFKEGLGGIVLRTPGAWDYPVRPWLYQLYTRTLPRLLDVMRRRGRQKTRNRLGG